MVNYIFIGDSNLFYQDPMQFPWSLFCDEQCTASMIAKQMDQDYYPFPLYTLNINWENVTRLKSLVGALGKHQPVSIVLWIGQSDAWSISSSQHAGADQDKSINLALQRVDKFITTIQHIHPFQNIFILEYHDHSSMASNDLYVRLSQSILQHFKLLVPEAKTISMPVVNDQMYVDGSHLNRSSQQLVADHVVTLIQEE